MDAAGDKRALALSFLQTVLPSEGTYFVARKTKVGAVYRDAVDTFEQIIDRIFGCTYDAWFSTASFNDKTKSDSGNVKLIRAFRMDVDCGYEKPYDTQRAGAVALTEFIRKTDLPMPGIVNSGNGLHLWWPLKDAIVKSVWEQYAKALKKLVVEHEFKVDAASIADSVRILRLPGTYNYKDRENPKEVKIEDKFFDRGPYDLQSFNHLLPNGEDKEIDFANWSGTALDNESLARYKAIIDGIPPSDDRDKWLKVGLGIKRLGWDEVGYELWENWSKKSTKFDPADQRKNWNSFDKEYAGRVVTPASLEYLSTGTKAEPSTKEEHKQKLNGENIGGEDTDWHNSGPTWQKTTSGHMKENSYINTKLAIEKLGIKCRYNEATMMTEVNLDAVHSVFDEGWVEANDMNYRTIRGLVIDRLHSDPHLIHVRNAVKELSDKSKYNSIIEYIDANHWDGVERIKTWLIDCLGAEDTEANRFFGEVVLIAAIRRQRKPGTKFDHTLILEGPEGIGKSTVVNILALEEIFSGHGYYAHMNFNRDINRFIESIWGAWWVEWDELAGIRNDLAWEHIKSCISQTVDQARLAYEIEAAQYYRKCIFVGTTNESLYLPNKPGNRRFWPVYLKDRIDLQKLRLVVPQLYAEANLKEKGYFDVDAIPQRLEEAIEKLQLSRIVEPVLRDYLIVLPVRETTLDGKEFVTNMDIKIHLGLTAKDFLHRGVANWEIKSAMKSLGWKESKKTIKGKTHRGYERDKILH